jgi:hypothetical protein
MYHFAGSPQSTSSHARAAYGQLYFIMDAETAAQQRMGQPENAGCNEALLTQLGSPMLEINPYAKAYKVIITVMTFNNNNNNNSFYLHTNKSNKVTFLY